MWPLHASLLRRFRALIIVFTLSALWGTANADAVMGMVWQPDYETIRPKGKWHLLGIQQLLVQWSVVDDISWVDANASSVDVTSPDWMRIAHEPWAKEVILGLAGKYNESDARDDVEKLAQLSVRLAKQRFPLNVVGWYFPVEADPTWESVGRQAQVLSTLPRPLWVSVYDNGNIGGQEFAQWLQTWLPKDVGVFFQDGVGLHVRSPAVALQYFHALSDRLGPGRVRLIAEAFRPKIGGGFRSASCQELSGQLSSYRGLPVFLFDGPHYVSDQMVTDCLAVGR